MSYRPTKELVLEEDEQFIVRATQELLVQADKILEFNYSGDKWFSLGAGTLNVLDCTTTLYLHAPIGGGQVICTYSEGVTV